MASSRWKRFAFFDRHTLSLPNEVLNDLIPGRAGLDGGSSSSRQQQQRLLSDQTGTGDNTLTSDSIRMVVTTAALPTSAADANSSSSSSSSSTDPNMNTKNDPTSAMWSSLAACSPAPMSSHTDVEGHSDKTGKSLKLPSQSQVASVASNATATATDGLVLLFCSSPRTDLVHCIDITIRCNPTRTSPLSKKSLSTSDTIPSSSSKNNKSTNTILEDLDGWRGYFSPFSFQDLDRRNSSNHSMDPTQNTTTIIEAPRAVLQGLACCRESTRLNNNKVHNASQQSSYNPVLLACISDEMVVLYEDPHLALSCRLPITVTASAAATGSSTTTTTTAATIPLHAVWNAKQHGHGRVLDLSLAGMVAVGTDRGTVLVYTIHNAKDNKLPLYMAIPPPPSLSSSSNPASNNTTATEGEGVVTVTSVKLVSDEVTQKMSLYVSYHRKTKVKTENTASSTHSTHSPPMTRSSTTSTGGVCCYDLGMVPTSTMLVSNSTGLTAPLARFDLDGRPVPSQSLCDVISSPKEDSRQYYMVAQPDGLYTYSQTQKVGVSPIDGTKIAICALPQQKRMNVARIKQTAAFRGDIPSSSSGSNEAVTVPKDETDTTATAATSSTVVGGSLYALVASTDLKSGRDAIDIFDATNKLVAFHVLLSPGHKALRAVGVATIPKHLSESGVPERGRSSAIVMTSGGSIVTLTEKVTSEKVSLLVQKNLFSAAISMAFCDPWYQPADITALYRRHAEHLYRKGDFSAAMDQYIFTIGSLESSHVIYRYLGAPKIPLLSKYLEELRSRHLATPVHNELLRACYLKLNDTSSSEKVSNTVTKYKGNTPSALVSIVSNLASQNPTEALATICSFPAPQAAEALVNHGAMLARVMPHEIAGIVVSLCVGTYSPNDLADAATTDAATTDAVDKRKRNSSASKLLEYAPTMAMEDDHPKTCDPYPVHVFAISFLENPKLLRLILAHCNRNKCLLTPSLRRTLLELNLAEWKNAKRTGDTETQNVRRKEVIAALTDSHAIDIGDYEALVLVQQASFAEGELLLYERLQMIPMLLARYAQDGGERARRQMLAMCQNDPEILANVLGYFVNMASVAITEEVKTADNNDATSDISDGEVREILDDIGEALCLARAQGVLPPVRIARILAGEGVGQFSSQSRITHTTNNQLTVPLSVALDYVGAILDESSKEMSRLKSEVEEYNELCMTMESEINSLVSATPPVAASVEAPNQPTITRIDIEEIYAKLRASVDEGKKPESVSDQSQEAFWREMGYSEDRFETIARFFAKGIVN